MQIQKEKEEQIKKEQEINSYQKERKEKTINNHFSMIYSSISIDKSQLSNL